MKVFLKTMLIMLLILTVAPVIAQIGGDKAQESTGQKFQDLTVEKCIEVALENNRRRPASQYAVEIAEAQYKQALSTYWPQLALKAVYTLMDEDPNYIFPPSTMDIGSLNLGGLNIEVPPVDVPQQDIKHMDRKNLVTSLDLVYPLYTGGKLSSIRKQTKFAVEMAKQEAKRTDLQVIYDVKRYYYAVVLAQNIYAIGTEALARLEVTLELTESLYKRGSGRVKKTDYLKNKIIVDNVRSLIAGLNNDVKVARAALGNAMGLEWGTSFELSAQEIPFKPYTTNLNAYVDYAYQFNPDWVKTKIAWKALKVKINQAKSGYFPQIALIGKLQHTKNSYEYGIVTPENKDMWTVGLGLQLPIFSGFRTKNKVNEAKARLNQLEQQEILLREGLALQIQHIFLKMISAQEKQKTAKQAMDAATENRNLIERAYQQELMEEKDLIESQIIESIMKAQYQKVLYDHFEAQAHLDFVAGKVVNNGQ